MGEHTKISFNHRKDLVDYGDLTEMLFPGNRNQQHAAVCILFELKWADGLVPNLMLVSAPGKSGNSNDNHWDYWLEDTTSEAARLAYVASSRPKHLLVWAVPKGNNGDMAKLTDIGFVPIYLDEGEVVSGNEIKDSDE